MERLGYRNEVVDRQLAHAPKNKVVSAYDRAKFLNERKVMMQAWADYVQVVEQKDSPSAHHRGARELMNPRDHRRRAVMARTCKPLTDEKFQQATPGEKYLRLFDGGG